MDIYETLTRLQIRYERYDHPPVFTCEEAESLVPPLPAAKTKNIFLRNKRGDRHFLLMVSHSHKVDLKKLAILLGSDKLSFGSVQRLKECLDIESGAVSILAVLNDITNRVEIVIDQSLWNCEAFQCHPLVNTATLVIARNDIEKLLEATAHTPCIIAVPEINRPEPPFPVDVQ